MSNKSYGLNKERELKKLFQKDPNVLFVSRSRGSFGKFDLEVYYKDHLKLISVKSTKQQYQSYKQEIEAIKKTNIPKYAQAWLYIYWSPRKDRSKHGWEMILIKTGE